MEFNKDLFWGHYYSWYTYINDLDSGIRSDISKFTDDSKIGRIIRSESDVIVKEMDVRIAHKVIQAWNFP